MAFCENRLYGRIVSGILALFWIWMGVFYYMFYFNAINPAARIFGALFVLEGLLLIVVGSFSGRISFGFNLKLVPIVGAIFILYAMIAYPLPGICARPLVPTGDNVWGGSLPDHDLWFGHCRDSWYNSGYPEKPGSEN